jgi:hypothetical protein
LKLLTLAADFGNIKAQNYLNKPINLENYDSKKVQKMI